MSDLIAKLGASALAGTGPAVCDLSPAVSAVPALVPDAREHDLSVRRWGRDYDIMRIHEDGERLELAFWATPMPKEGEFVLLKHPATSDGKTRYRLTDVNLCGNPRDMAFAVAVYDPRKSDIDGDESAVRQDAPNPKDARHG